MAGSARLRSGRGRADLDLRGPPGLLAASRRRKLAQLQGAGGGAAPVRQGPRLHAPRIASHHRAPARPELGVPDGRLLRPDLSSWYAGRLQGIRGRRPWARPRGDTRLGSGPFSPRCAWSGAVRWDPPLRAPGPEARISPGLGYGDLRLREARGDLVSRVERLLLAGGVPPRRTPCGCGRLHALPRLFAEGRRVASQRTGRERESRRGGVTAALERRGS